MPDTNTDITLRIQVLNLAIPWQLRMRQLEKASDQPVSIVSSTVGSRRTSREF